MQVYYLGQSLLGHFDTVATSTENTSLQEVLVRTEHESERSLAGCQRQIGAMLGIKSQVVVSNPVFHESFRKTVKKEITLAQRESRHAGVDQSQKKHVTCFLSTIAIEHPLVRFDLQKDWSVYVLLNDR